MQILHEKKRAEIEAQKLMTFGRLLGGAGGGGRGLPESSDSAENGEWPQSRPAPPAGVRRILRATPSAAGPLWLRGIAIWGPRCLLFDILGGILAPREHLGEPFWHLGSTLGGHFGTSGAPWEAILAPRDHPEGPWEQQHGHEVANDRILVDFGVISGPILSVVRVQK